MANVKLFKVEQYTSDFGDVYENVPFKVEEVAQDRLNVAFPIRTPNDRSNRCASSRYFSMRKAIIIFKDGFSTEVPIASLDLIPNTISNLKANDQIACVGLKGEKWRVVPPGILGGNYASTGLEGAVKPEKSKFVYKYTLDGLQNPTIVSSTSIETAPDVLFTAQQTCLDKDTDGSSLACSISQGFTQRRFKGTRANTSTGGSFGRNIIISSSTESVIKACGLSVMSNFNCLAYQGQSMPNANDFYT